MNNIIEKIAKNHNCTPEEVEEEISFAISEAKKCSASDSIKFWKDTKSNISVDELIFATSLKALLRLHFR